MNLIYKLNEKDLKIWRATVFFLILALVASFVNFKAFSLGKTDHAFVTFIFSVLFLLVILASKWFVEGLVIKGILLYSGGNLGYRQVLNIIVNNQIVLIVCTLCLSVVSMFDNQVILYQSGKVVKLVMQTIYMLAIFKSIWHMNQNLNKYKLLIPLMIMVGINVFI